MRKSKVLPIYALALTCLTIVSSRALAVAVPDQQADLSQWQAVSADLARYSLGAASTYIGKVGNYGYADVGQVSRDNVWLLSSYINLPGLDNFSLPAYLPSEVPSLPDSASIDITALDSRIASHFNPAQLAFLNEYFTSNLALASTNQAALNYNHTWLQVQGSSLSRDEKIVVLAMVGYAHAFAMELAGRIDNGMLPDGSLGVVVSTGGCSIRFRDVWRSAIEGGVAGAITLGIYGALGGTIIVPVLGTASGWVAGAVVGFASGFAGGALHSIGSQLFWNCLLSSPLKLPDNHPCNTDADFAFHNPQVCSANAWNRRWYRLPEAAGSPPGGGGGGGGGGGEWPSDSPWPNPP